MMLARFASLWPERKSLHPAGIHVPLYVYPGDESYDRIARARQAHPAVPIVVTVNPSSGPGTARDPSYDRAVGMLRAAGVSVIGYVYTSWGKRGLAGAAADMCRYKEWYGLDGVMLDEFSTRVGSASYYLALRGYAKSLGMAFVMANPGTDVPEQFVGVLADNFTIYENAGLPGSDRLGGWHAGYGRENWSCCSYGTCFDERRLRALTKHVGLVYMTDDLPPNPYDRLSSYFERMVEALDPK